MIISTEKVVGQTKQRSFKSVRRTKQIGFFEDNAPVACKEAACPVDVEKGLQPSMPIDSQTGTEPAVPEWDGRKRLSSQDAIKETEEFLKSESAK